MTVKKPRRSRWPFVVVVVLLALAAGGLWKKRASSPPAAVQAVPAAPASPAIPQAMPSDKGVADNVQRFRQQAEAEFRAADTNNDGFLSLDETRARFPFLAKEFKRIDTDDDGRISPREFFQAKRIVLERRLNKQAN